MPDRRRPRACKDAWPWNGRGWRMFRRLASAGGRAATGRPAPNRRAIWIFTVDYFNVYSNSTMLFAYPLNSTTALLSFTSIIHISPAAVALVQATPGSDGAIVKQLMASWVRLVRCFGR